MARAEADMGVTPAGSPTTDPPHAVAPMGSAAAGGDDNDEEAQMLHARVSYPPPLPPLPPSSITSSASLL